MRETNVLDYLRIMINARLAKMDERGASAVEYGLLVAGIAAVIVAVVFALGSTLQGVFGTPPPRRPGRLSESARVPRVRRADGPPTWRRPCCA
jgi:pilus assembly protein Flp/PilA